MLPSFCQRLAALALVLSPVTAQTALPSIAPSQAELRAHYARVEVELRRTDAGDLTESQRKNRARMLDALRDYRIRGRFGIEQHPGGRAAAFVDRFRTRCAVARLMDVSGAHDLVLDVAAKHNDAWVAELSGVAAFRSWLAEVGLTLAEAARIQGPMLRVGGSPPTPSPPVKPPEPIIPGDAFERPPASDPLANADGVRPGGRAPNPGAITRASRGTRRRSGPTSGVVLTTEPSEWFAWWQLGRFEFLRSNTLRPRARVTTPVPSDGDNRGFFVRQRNRLRRLALELLEHRDYRVRATAAIALGRVATDNDVPPLLEHVTDPSQQVRADAILGLGASCSPRAVHHLLKLASDVRESTRRRALAILALGIARGYGYDWTLGAEVADLATGEKATRNTLGQAAMFHAALTKDSELLRVALANAKSSKTSPQVRTRAEEALRHSSDDDALRVLVQQVSSRRVDHRRAAATALGEMRHELALPSLLTSFELEHEPLTRGFLAIAIARQGGREARDFLIHSLQTGKKSARPWCALALGLLAHDAPDRLVRSTLREAMARDKNREHVGAYLIASGLARDAQALPAIRKQFFDAKSAHVRIAATHALALIRGDAIRAELLKPLPTLTCTFQRGAIAEVLGYLGNPDDTKVLAEMLEKTNDTRERAKITAALGNIGTPAAVDLLFAVAADKARDIRVRGTALRALGEMLTEHPTHTLARLVARSDYLSLPEWFRDAVALTL